MDGLAATFARCRDEGRAALLTYIMAGDPTLKASKEMALACVRGGADILEIGMPFSDPIGDGPTIQRAGERSLAQGTTLDGCLALAAELHEETHTPVVLMGYLNPILAYGEARFLDRCRRARVAALIIPELPPEEAVELSALARDRGVGMVFLVTPTSTPARRQAAAAAATAFLYLVSVTGVTGARAELPPELGALAAEVRAASSVPVVVGFGVSTPDHARAIGRMADGVVVGSAIVSRIAEEGTTRARAARVRGFVSSLRSGLDPR
jgi:tryptophan synthase alpha chain